MPDRITHWRIEWTAAHGPRWWAGQGSDFEAFTTTGSVAVQFSRKQDANAVIDGVLRGVVGLRATEHER